MRCWMFRSGGRAGLVVRARTLLPHEVAADVVRPDKPASRASS